MPAPDKHKEHKHKAAGGRKKKKKKPIVDHEPQEVSSDDGVEYLGRQYTPRRKRGIMVPYTPPATNLTTPSSSSSRSAAASSPRRQRRQRADTSSARKSRASLNRRDDPDSDIEQVGQLRTDGQLEMPSHLNDLFRGGASYGDNDGGDPDNIMNLQAGPSSCRIRSKHSPVPQRQPRARPGASSSHGQASSSASSSRFGGWQGEAGVYSSRTPNTHYDSSHATSSSSGSSGSSGSQSRHRSNGIDLQGEDVGPVIEEVE